MIYLCRSYTIVELSACKAKGHIGTFQRYFHSSSQRASRLLFITTSIVDPWILAAAWWASIQRWKSNGAQAIMREKLIFSIPVMEVENPLSSCDLSTSDGKYHINNDWIYQIHLLLPWTSRHDVGTRPIFLTKKQQKDCWQRKNPRCMILHDHEFIWAKIRCCTACTKLQQGILNP